MKITWKIKDNHARIFYIDGQQTNLYAFTPKYKYYNQGTWRRTLKECIFFLKLMRDGKIKVKKEFSSIDICSTLENYWINPEIRFIEKEEINLDCGSLISVDHYGRLKTKEEVYNQVKLELMTNSFVREPQACKVINFEDKKLLKNIGILYGKYGYCLYAI